MSAIEVLKLKNIIKKLRKEVKFLEILEGMADVGSWDLDSICSDISATGESEGVKYSNEFLKWLIKRYDLKKVLGGKQNE